jgi:hypothetical protein
MVELSNGTWDKIRRIFPRDQQQRAADLLRTQCGENLPLMRNGTPEGLERIRFAALKLSEGNIEKLERSIVLANKDWRDLLMTAGFGQLGAHLEWIP